MLNQYRMQAGLKETGNVLDWFATEPTAKAIKGTDDLTQALADAGYQAAITADQATDSWRNLITGTLDMVQEGRQQLLEAVWEAATEKVAAEGEAKMEAANEAADKAK